MKTLTVELDAETYTRLQIMSAEEERTVEGEVKAMVKNIVDGYFEEKERKKHLTTLLSKLNDNLTGDARESFISKFKM